ncbi:hypothetical protein B0T19DRAFT_294236 [Cercophora scortea]|uniref:Uncharacterized protein n=1 Tax=Cercophora scortea TaxID=314031 RepID=A0AAE0I2V6_9PEZI|nr:hypothetical protein B0T19DRAFT_294236 [Cercophora scortea]
MGWARLGGGRSQVAFSPGWLHGCAACAGRETWRKSLFFSPTSPVQSVSQSLARVCSRFWSFPAAPLPCSKPKQVRTTQTPVPVGCPFLPLSGVRSVSADPTSHKRRRAGEKSISPTWQNDAWGISPLCGRVACIEQRLAGIKREPTSGGDEG